MTPAEELTAAADKLDKRASEATPGAWNVDGPWWWEAPGGPTGSAMVTAGLARDAVVIAPQGARSDDARYIAIMQPLVGEALAGLLRLRADQLRHDRRVEGNHPLTAKLLDLARLINGGAS